ncbi:MAG: hypothetical protein ACR2NP_07420 [Pirellulaceae bacterium]
MKKIWQVEISIFLLRGVHCKRFLPKVPIDGKTTEMRGWEKLVSMLLACSDTFMYTTSWRWIGLKHLPNVHCPRGKQGTGISIQFLNLPQGWSMSTQIVRLVTRDSDGSVRIREYKNTDSISKSHEQIGIDDCSTDLSLRGMPVFRGLVGPIPEARGICRYESPDVFESATKDWAKAKVKRRRRRSANNATATAGAPGVDGFTTGPGSMSTA